MPELKNALECPTKDCKSIVFYDWGLQVYNKKEQAPVRLDGAPSAVKDWAGVYNVRICAFCNTPFVFVEEELLDISDHLGPEDVQRIISRGQTTLPHVKIKDP